MCGEPHLDAVNLFLDMIKEYLVLRLMKFAVTNQKLMKFELYLWMQCTPVLLLFFVSKTFEAHCANSNQKETFEGDVGN